MWVILSHAATAVPVAGGWTWSTTFQLAQAVITAVIGGGFLKAWVQNGPLLRKIEADATAAAAAVRRDDMDDMRERITQLEAKVEGATQAAHKAEMKLVYAVSAVQLLAAKIRAENPNDPTLRQAAELLAAATSGDLPGWEQKLTTGLTKDKP